jgi:hypothetical protein
LERKVSRRLARARPRYWLHGPLTASRTSTTIEKNAPPNFSQGGTMRARFLGKDPNSQVDNSPTLFATDRTDRVTYIAQGWKVTDPQALADVGPVPDHET